MGVTGRNILAFVVGVVVTMSVNMGIIMAGPHVVAPPAGVDMKDPESLKAGIHLLEAKHWAVPLLAHAMGSLVGAFVGALLAASNRLQIALGIGALHMLGGISMRFMIPSPNWFTALDLIGAYLPMALLGYKAAESVHPPTVPAGKVGL
jgi:hypothetical protein